MNVRTAIGVCVTVLWLLSLPVAAEAAAQFRLTYRGTADWSTAYHSTPANPGGNPDTNDAHDSSSERWSLSFIAPLSYSAADRGSVKLTGARGATRASGRIAHTHLDGLYPADNAAVSCHVTASTPARQLLPVSIEAIYLGARGIRITALDPVSQALTLLPQQCPGQGDSLDGLADNYFGPGFSSAGGYGPDRWFRSRSVVIALAGLRPGAALTIRLGPARGDSPPADCAVPHPAWQRCRTGGTWRGTLTLRRVR